VSHGWCEGAPQADSGHRRAQGEVAVWVALLDLAPATVRGLSVWLSRDEIARADCFVSSRDRVRFITGRAFLRSVLAVRLGIAPSEVRFQYAPHGKPALEEPVAHVPFNLAHSDGLAVCALADGDSEIGVDVERIRPLRDADAVARAVFSPAELARYDTLNGPTKLRAFFEAWTRKEAFLKALGCGLARPLQSFDVAFGPGEPPRLVASRVDPDEVGRVVLHGFEHGDDVVGAVATFGGRARVIVREWRWPASESFGTRSTRDVRVDA